MNNKSYIFKKYFIKILKKYKKKTYEDFLGYEYPITEIVQYGKNIFNVEIVLFEKYPDYLLLGLEVILLEPKKISLCGRNSIRRTFAIYDKNFNDNKRYGVKNRI